METTISHVLSHLNQDWILLTLDEINYLDGVIYFLMQKGQQVFYVKRNDLHKKIVPALQSWLVILPLTSYPTERDYCQYCPIPPARHWLISVLEMGLDQEIFHSLAVSQSEVLHDRSCRGMRTLQGWALTHLNRCDNYHHLYRYYTSLTDCRETLLNKLQQS